MELEKLLEISMETNRLGSDAIADITVFGRIAGQNVVKDNK